MSDFRKNAFIVTQKGRQVGKTTEQFKQLVESMGLSGKIEVVSPDILELNKKLAIAEKALDFYTKHPVHWDKDENGNLIDEGPSKVAKEALAKIRGN